MVEQAGKRVGLFVTCLVDLIRPSVGFAAGEAAGGCRLHRRGAARRPAAASRPSIPATAPTARAIAAQVIAAFARYDYVVAPSGSCAGMLKAHYPELFDDDPQLARAGRGARRARPTSSIAFLVDVLGVTRGRRRSSTAPSTYHDSCSGLRELGVKAQPRQLLASVRRA